MKYIPVLILLSAALLAACKKDKQDYEKDNRVTTDPRANSGVRLVNVREYNQVVANGDTLTNYKVIPSSPEFNQWEYPGTPYFPSNGRLGATWYLPRSLFGKNGTASLMIESKGFQSMDRTLTLDVKDDYNTPVDYYLLTKKEETYVIDAPPEVVAVPRSVHAPSRADHFKIRIVNMAAKVETQFQEVEDVAQPLTLAWADGTPVNAATSNIAPGAYSEYVELPYGTYQFKILMPNGHQVTAAVSRSTEYVHKIDPATSTITKDTSGRPHAVSTGLTYAPFKTYQPGGIYSIVIAPATFVIPYYLGNPGEEVAMFQNGFRVISDAGEPVNYTYARMQWVNALPGTAGVSLAVNGRKIGEGLDFGMYSAYSTCITEEVKVIAADASGKELAAATHQVQAGMNYTAWLYADESGKAKIAVVTNNLSGVYTVIGNNSQDATYDRYKRTYPIDLRFLNFCADLPYVTFRQGNGQPVGSDASENLQPGIVPVNTTPYARYTATSEAYQLKVYRSTPSVVPGAWLPDIPTVYSEELIARPALYSGGKMPAHEPGVYTIALIGQYKTGAPAAEKARMIIVKHTR